MTKNDDQFIAEIQKDFLEEVSFLLEECEESYLKLENPDCRAEKLETIFRLAHNIKGGGSVVGYQDLADFAHLVEDCLSILRTYPQLVDIDVISLLLKTGDAFKERISAYRRKDSSPWLIEDLKNQVKNQIIELERKTNQSGVSSSHDPAWKQLAQVTQTSLSSVNQKPNQGGTTGKESGSIKVDTDRIETLLNLVGELVVIKSQLLNHCSSYLGDLKLGSLISLMDKTVVELQDKTLSIRMTPLKSLFLKAQRIIRDLSVKLNKPVEFQMFGEDTEIDRTMVELLSDPLIHMVRNSLDHGIEKNEIRKERSKSEKGLIHLIARQAAGKIIIEVKDDGGGIPRQKVVEKAKRIGLIPQDVSSSSLTDQQIFNLICEPGFSSADQVTDLSGRGVGMDVVKTNIEKLKGTIDLESKEGVGTLMRISLPVTTSITDGVIAEVNGENYVLPMEYIRELVKLDSKTLLEVKKGQDVFNHRGKIIPIVDLASALSKGRNSGRGTNQMLALVQAREGLVALRLGQVLGQTQVVLKPLGEKFESVKGVSGAAILGDGRVGLILDPQELVDQNSSRDAFEPGESFGQAS